jgi:hypothetical protein
MWFFTLDVQTYDGNDRHAHRVSPALTQPSGHPIGVGGDDGAPNFVHLEVVSERLLDGPAAELGQHLVVGHARGVAGPEGLLQPVPQVG